MANERRGQQRSIPAASVQEHAPCMRSESARQSHETGRTVCSAELFRAPRSSGMCHHDRAQHPPLRNRSAACADRLSLAQLRLKPFRMSDGPREPPLSSSAQCGSREVERSGFPARACRFSADRTEIQQPRIRGAAPTNCGRSRTRPGTLSYARAEIPAEVVAYARHDIAGAASAATRPQREHEVPVHVSQERISAPLRLHSDTPVRVVSSTPR